MALDSSSHLDALCLGADTLGIVFSFCYYCQCKREMMENHIIFTNNKNYTDPRDNKDVVIVDENCQVIEYSGDLEALAKYLVKEYLHPMINMWKSSFTFHPGDKNKIILSKYKVEYNFVPTDITAKWFNLLHKALKELK